MPQLREHSGVSGTAQPGGRTRRVQGGGAGLECPMPVRYSSARFVGRDLWFGRLAATLDDAAHGRARTLLIDGTAGVGVTRFLDEAIARIRALAPPMTILRASAWPCGVDEPYGPLVRAIGPALRKLSPGELSDALGPATLEVLRLLPDLAGRLDERCLAVGPGESAPERRQARTLEGILGLLGRLGERDPVVLVLEDLHRADAATRALVTFLARISNDQRLAIIGTHQPDAVARGDPWIADQDEIASGPRAPERVSLVPLDRDEIAALIEGIEGERAPASLLLLVAERSGGLPLLAEELLAARRELPTASLTGSFDGLVGARLSIRSQECRRVLRLVALAERPMSAVQLAAVAAAYDAGSNRSAPRSVTGPRHGDGVLDADLRAGLTEALANGFLVDAGGAIMFRHESIGSAVARDLLPMARTRHHAALASGLGGPPSAVAWHSIAAHDPQTARAAFIEAAAFAEQRHAAMDELTALEAALALPGSAPATTVRRRTVSISDRVDLQVRAAEAAFAVGRTSRATSYLEAAIASLDARRDRVRLGLLHERLANVRRAAGDPTGAMMAARRAVELVPREPSPERATVLASLAQFKMLDGTFADAQRLAREAIKVARACDPVARRQEIHATTTLGVAMAWGSDPAEAIEVLREAGRAAAELDDPDALFRVRANLTTVLDLVGQHAEAVDVAYAGIRDARRAGLEAVYGNFLAGNVAESLFLLGRWPEARDLSARAISWLPVGVPYLASILQLAIVEIETDAGEEASRLLGQTILAFDALRETQLAGPYYLAAASFAFWRGEIADASRSVERGWASLRATEEWLLVARMASMVAQVDAATAVEARRERRLAPLAAARSRTAEVVAAAAKLVRASGAPRTAGSRRVAEASLATARAHQRRLEGDDDASVWDRVATGWAALDAPYDVALARWRQAEALLAAGLGRSGRADAHGPLLEAVKLALGLHARPLLRELRELAGRARITLPPEVDVLLDDQPPAAVSVMAPVGRNGRPTAAEIGRSDLVRAIAGDPPSPGRRQDTFGLSSREREVLGLVAQGRTNREIGERLFISQKTVGVHVGNILSKLEVSGRVEAAAVSIRLGLTERR